MTVRAEDLPKAVRDRLGLSGDLGKAQGLPRRPPDLGGPVRCHECGDAFPHYGGRNGWEKHSNETGHGRADLILERAR